MYKKIQRTMEELHMVDKGEVILAAVSGGADSVCLLLLLKELSQRMEFSLEAIHVEHGIRGEESLADEAFVVALCERLAVPLESVHVDVLTYAKKTGTSIEEAARVLRYQAFAQAAHAKQAKVALAHHMEDNAETILFQMLRGSSLNGLCGMQQMRIDAQGVTYIRPLLEIHRQEIEAFLGTMGQTYCTDSTNQELEYSRNYLRNVVLPQLVSVNEQAVEHINETAQRLRVIWEYMETETDKAWKVVAQESVTQTSTPAVEEEAVPEQTRDASQICVSVAEEISAQELAGDALTTRMLRLEIEALVGYPLALQRELVLRAISTVSGSKKDITAAHIAAVLELCNKQSGREVHLPYQLMAVRAFGYLYITSQKKRLAKKDAKKAVIEVCASDLARAKESGEALEIPLGEDDKRLVLRVMDYDAKEGIFPKKTYTKAFDYDKIKQGFCIRTRQSGDYFICDSLGHHKKLKSYFVDEKISQEKRERMWLIAQGFQVLWLIGGRMSEHVKVTAETKTMIQIEYQGGKEHGFYTEA